MEYTSQEIWDKRFLNIAKEISTWSKDPSRKIGAVLVKHNQILGTGYNGFPKGIKDDERLNQKDKNKYIIHAELNAILNALKYGIPLKDSTIYVYGLPICSECAKHLIQVQVKKVVTKYNEIGTWKESTDLAKEMFKEVNIDYIEYS